MVVNHFDIVWVTVKGIRDISFPIPMQQHIIFPISFAYVRSKNTLLSEKRTPSSLVFISGIILPSNRGVVHKI